MKTISNTWLRTVLLLDAATCLVSGLVMTTGAGLIARLGELPPSLLDGAGRSLFPIALIIAVLGWRFSDRQLAVWLVIVGNAGWVLASLGLVLTGDIAPNAIGMAFVLA